MAVRVQRVMPLVMSAIMAFVMSGAMTLVHLGFGSGFFWNWMKAYAVAWPIAAIGASLIAPFAFRIAVKVTDAINRRFG